MDQAGLAHFINRLTMEFVRVYPHPIERVWRAIIEPEEFAVWFIPGRLETRVGGRYWFGDDGFQGTVRAIEAPHLLQLDDDSAGQFFQYELTEVTDGTRMQFVHRFPPDHGYVEKADPTGDGEVSFELGGDLPGGPDTPWRPGFVGGFHEMYDRLAEFLDGVPIGSRLPPTEISTFVGKWANVQPGLNGMTDEERKQRALTYRALRARERALELIGIYRDHIKATIPPV